eukprot:TRINITY_DN17569_c0_g1_i1.p1 TRINITY_DN17569_c0_g1~~TRINITY_DN17569_c0_g1_i1.p1  ORF type:complete len:632 (-),score=144.26 TRINITY_DN17569_c0_g1_i1:8-1903(-)
MSKRDGHVFILVLEAKNTSGERWFRNTANAYCKVYLDGEKVYKTEIIEKSTDPKWQEKARHLPLKGRSATELKLALWDQSKLSWNKHIGEVIFKLDELTDGVPRDEWYTLKAKNSTKVTGDVHLQILYLEPNDNMTPTYDEFPHPLQTLLRKGKLEPFKRALATKDLENCEDKKDGLRPLHVACELNLPDCVSLLLEKGAMIEGTAANGSRPLHWAAKGSADAVKVLLAKGASKTAADAQGRTPLHYAAMANNPATVDLLIDAGAEVDPQDKNGQTPLHLAVQEKEADKSLAALMKHKADPLKNDNANLPPAKLCLDETKCPLKTRLDFFKAANVVDEREFALARDFPHREVVTGDLLTQWQKNDQFSFTHDATKSTKETNAVRLIMHLHEGDKPGFEKMAKCGFMVIPSAQADHKEPSYQTAVAGYGANEPLALLLRNPPPPPVQGAPANSNTAEKPYYTAIPYAKNDTVRAKYSIVIYSQEALSIKTLKDWKHSSMAAGSWTPTSAGGCKASEDTWANNPKYKIVVPAGQESVEVCVMLSQAKAMQLDPYTPQVTPCQFFIGFYIYDRTGFNPIYEYPRWLNALDVWDVIKLDTRKENEFVIIPTTFKPGQLTSFTLTVMSDQNVAFAP